MPTLKTEILGSFIEINYDNAEKNKLKKIIEKFNNRLLDFKNLEGKVSDNKILFLESRLYLAKILYKLICLSAI